jgi:hypothetical protein
VGERTALINQLRAILLERSTTVAQGRRKLEQHLAGLNPPGGLSQGICVLIEDKRRQWCELDRRITELDMELAEWVRNEECRDGNRSPRQRRHAIAPPWRYTF